MCPRMRTEETGHLCLLLLLLAVTAGPALSLECSEGQCYSLRVEESGNDTATCLSGEIPCETLHYVLKNLCNCSRVVVNYTRELSFTEAVYITHRSGLAIIGEGTQTVHCSYSSGIGFEYVDDVSIVGIEWLGCSISHHTTVLHPSQNLTFPNVSSALYFYHSANVNVSNCQFTSNRGCGITLYDVGGEVRIADSAFVNNTLEFECKDLQCYNRSVGIQIEKTRCGGFTRCGSPITPDSYTSHSNYLIENCLFYGNNNTLSPHLTRTEAILTYSEHRTLGHGGGIGIRLMGTAQFNSIQIRNCTFTENSALWGGGIEAGVGEESSSNVISITESEFSHNHAITGGALRWGLFPPNNYSGYGVNQTNNSFLIFDTSFSENNASSAGAISYFSDSQVELAYLSRFNITRCNFTRNIANFSGAAIGMATWPNEIGGYPTTCTFTNCIFDSNRIFVMFGVSSVYGLGSIFSEGIPLFFSGSNHFLSNQGSALALSDTTAFMEGDVLFRDNFGLNGGALHFIGLAWITLTPGLTLTFLKNNAHLSGGAIFSSYSIPRALNDTRYCIITFHPDSLEWNVNVSFVENTAGVLGQSLYLSTPGGCYRSKSSNLPFTDERIYHYYPWNELQIATAPSKIEFDSPAVKVNDTYTTSITLGEHFVIHPLTEDFYGRPSFSTALMQVLCDPLSPQCNHSTDSDYSLSGQEVLQLSNTKITTSFSLVGPENSNQRNSTVLFLFSDTLPSAISYLHLNITQCKLGNYYDSSSHQCQCFPSENIYCEDQKACIKYGYWIGPIEETSSHPRMVLTNCPNNFCGFSNGHCPMGHCTSTFQSYCLLPERDPDLLCTGNRGGIFCSSCRPGYAFSFGALNCVPEDTCNASNTVLMVFLVLVFWALLVIGLLVVLKLNMRIGSGSIYALLYYFGVLSYFTTNNLPSAFLTTVVLTFTSFIQLNPEFIGLIPLCFAPNFNSIGHQMFHYIHPFFITLVILAIIGITRCWPRFATISKLNLSLRAVCILLYLSFTSLSETSLTLLKFITYEDVPGVYVKIQPVVKYFDPAHHMPFAIVAILIMIIVLLFLFLMLFSPFLARVRGVNLTRIKPILDEYQSCYKDEYRWFAGYYLACRQLVFIFSLVDLGEFGGIFFLQILSIVVLVIHAVFQPYRKQWLNILDTILLSDLAIYSLLNGSTANVVFGNKVIRDVLVHILILIPVLYFLSLCIFHLTRKLHARYRGRRLEDSGRAIDPFSSSSNDLYTPALREPLLSSQVDLSVSYGSERRDNASITPEPPPTSDTATTSSQGPWYKQFTRKSHTPSHKSTQQTRELQESCTTDVHSKLGYTVSTVGAPTGLESD